MEEDGGLNVSLKRMSCKPNKIFMIVSITWLISTTCFFRYVHLFPRCRSETHQYRVKAKLLIGEKYPPERPFTIPEVPSRNLNDDEKFKRQHQLTLLKEIQTNISNIFFLETRCAMSKHSEEEEPSPDKGVVLNARQLCAIESTARMNPNRPVYILHSCPLDDYFFDKSAKYFQEMWMTYWNIHLVHLEALDLFILCNLEDMYYNSEFRKSKNYMIAHLSDILRIITLWHFGGTYMDLDVISMRPIDDLGQNYAGWQDSTTLATGVLNFGHTEFSRRFLKLYIETFGAHFDPRSWSGNGPELFTDLMATVYGTEMNSEHEKNFSGYVTSVFYPIYYSNWRLFFDDDACDYVLNELNHTYIVHLWNQLSKNEEITVGSNQAYGILADKYCPKVYGNCGAKF